MVPKLVAEDIPLLFSLLSDVFPGVQYMRGEMTALREELKKVCAEMYLTYGDGDDVGSMWVEKVNKLSVFKHFYNIMIKYDNYVEFILPSHTHQKNLSYITLFLP